jgi:hypothetical protein
LSEGVGNEPPGDPILDARRSYLDARLWVIHAQEPGTKAAQMSVEAWLSLIDNQSYAASWDAAASIFRNVSDN